MRALVAVGQKMAAYPTLYAQYAITEPQWAPVNYEHGPELDLDLIRKQGIESELAWGTDL